MGGNHAARERQHSDNQSSLRRIKHQVQFISHHNERYGYLDSVRIALLGGCRWIQLRMKNATDDEVRPIAIEAQRLCREAGATFIIDDRVELVRELRADGVHLGKNDMPIAAARQLLGPGFIIGGTANTFADVKAISDAGGDYVGCGPFRFTTTKEKLSPILGLDGYRHIVSRRHAADTCHGSDGDSPERSCAAG